MKKFILLISLLCFIPSAHADLDEVVGVTIATGAVTKYSSIGDFSDTDNLVSVTDTTHVELDSNSGEDIDDFHIGLKFIYDPDSTDGGPTSSIILDYVASTNVITLETPIAGMDAAEDYTVECVHKTSDSKWLGVRESNPDTNYGGGSNIQARVQETVGAFKKWALGAVDLLELSAASITGVTIWVMDYDSTSSTWTVYDWSQDDFIEGDGTDGSTWNCRDWQTSSCNDDWDGAGDVEDDVGSSLTANATPTQYVFEAFSHADLTTNANTDKGGWWAFLFKNDSTDDDGFYRAAVTNTYQRPWVAVVYTE